MQVCLRFWMLLHWDFMFNASVLVGFDIGYFFQVFELGGFLVCLHCGFIGLLKLARWRCAFFWTKVMKIKTKDSRHFVFTYVIYYFMLKT
ncbi:hypothetical protein HanRHA438_Chr16g0751811 [Helianthus annuus]|nr:hypothetical protein HanRHA438_Chr16g0751811 [Helianthus annuus]